MAGQDPLLCARVPVEVKRQAVEQARREGFNVSVWLRRLVLRELRDTKAGPRFVERIAVRSR